MGQTCHRHHLLRLLGALLLLLQASHSNAVHIFGGELLYRHVSGNTYRVEMTLYGDCGAPEETFNNLYVATPLIWLYRHNTFADSFRLAVDTAGIEVSQVCPNQLNQTKCHGGTLPGVRKFVYSHTITLSDTSLNWRFIFGGYLGFYNAGRSQSITNIIEPGSTVTRLEATLNNTIGANSSPVYSTIPTPYYCNAMPQEYNMGAIDADSLTFALVPGRDGASGYPLAGDLVSYQLSFTYDQPITASGFSFDPATGQMSFTPYGIQDALVVTQVNEFRSGILVGTSQREMTFIVQDNCTGTVPGVSINNVHGAVLGDDSMLYVCNRPHHVSFALPLTNPDGDTCVVTANNLPGTAAINVAGNHSPAPGITFDWDIDSVANGSYTFYLTVKALHCPMSNTQTRAYVLNVAPIPSITAVVVSPTECVHRAVIHYELEGGFLPRDISVANAATNTIVNYTDLTGVNTITDSLYAGNYMVRITSDSLCSSVYDLNVPDSGVLPLGPVHIAYCTGDTAGPVYIQPAGPGASFSWCNAAHTAISGPPTPPTDSVYSYTWHVSEQYKTCISDLQPVTATIHALPQVQILSTPASICYGDSIYLAASGAASYRWGPASALLADGNGNAYLRAVAPTQVTVYATDSNGCTDSASWLYANIQNCCEFIYPTAFTPNNDGRNDGYRVIPIGNLYYYHLAIYDRWGHLMFLSYDHKLRWDGMHGGMPCAAGVYFYYFTAQCLTGQIVERKGDITLIR